MKLSFGDWSSSQYFCKFSFPTKQMKIITEKRSFRLSIDLTVWNQMNNQHFNSNWKLITKWSVNLFLKLFLLENIIPPFETVYSWIYNLLSIIWHWLPISNFLDSIFLCKRTFCMCRYDNDNNCKIKTESDITRFYDINHGRKENVRRWKSFWQQFQLTLI